MPSSTKSNFSNLFYLLNLCFCSCLNARTIVNHQWHIPNMSKFSESKICDLGEESHAAPGFWNGIATIEEHQWSENVKDIFKTYMNLYQTEQKDENKVPTIATFYSDTKKFAIEEAKSVHQQLCNPCASIKQCQKTKPELEKYRPAKCSSEPEIKSEGYGECKKCEVSYKNTCKSVGIENLETVISVELYRKPEPTVKLPFYCDSRIRRNVREHYDMETDNHGRDCELEGNGFGYKDKIFHIKGSISRETRKEMIDQKAAELEEICRELEREQNREQKKRTAELASNV